MLRLVLAGFLALALAPNAAALLPPQAYAEARANAANVVVIDVDGVEFVSDSLCAVSGRVAQVERGEKYEAGAEVRIDTPCRGHVAVMPMPGPVIYQDSAALQASTRGRAYLDAEGRLARWKYEIIAIAAED